MAWPKVFTHIMEKLESIEEKLDRMAPAAAARKTKESEGGSESKLLKGSLVDDFDSYTVSDALRKIKTLTQEEKLELLEHEREGKKRSPILDALSKE